LGAALKRKGATAGTVSAQKDLTMQVSQDALQSSTENQANLSLRGHQPQLFKGQKAAILALLRAREGEWVPCYELSNEALQYSARVKELRNAGYVIENRKLRHGRQIHGAFRLIACPGDPSEGL
jgi:hypothetical protein